MKKIYILSITLYSMAITASAQAPVGKGYLDINNIKAAFYSSGDLFWDHINKPEFEVPKGNKGKNSTMFASSLWIGGIDVSGQLKIAANTYRQTGIDFWPGPLNSTATTDPLTIDAYNKVWKINKCDIDTYHNWCLTSVGNNPVDSATMDVINTWPAFTIDGSSLAPFVDVNGDGFYDPSQCDYPQIKGDQALFFVFNDKGGIHSETGGQSIGLEIQAMAYAYNCTSDSALYNTIFTDYKIINKSSFRLDSAFIGYWTDPEIGYYLDDYVASDVTRGAFYAYNADGVDGNGGPYSYGNTPPAQAVVFLAGPWADPNGIDDPVISTPNGTDYGDGIIDNERLGLSKCIYYNNDFTVQGNPAIAVDCYNYLTGNWKDGTPLTYGGDGYSGGSPCDYTFPGNSDPLGYGTNMNPQSPWSAAGTSPGDKRMVGSVGPFTFVPGGVEVLSLAYVFGRTTQGTPNPNMASVTVMKERIDSIRNKFDSGRLNACMCNSGTTGVTKLTNDNVFTIYPNPSTDNITINYKSSAKNYNIKMYDATGRMVKNMEYISSAVTVINIEDLNSGIYLLNVYDEKNSSVKRFIKQ